MLGYLLSCFQVNLFLCLRQLLPTGKPRERQAHSIAFNLKDTSKHLFCATGVPVGEVQLAPLSLPRGARGQLATPPSWYRADPASNVEARRLFAMLPSLTFWRLFEGGVYSRKYGTLIDWCLYSMGAYFYVGAYTREALACS